MSPPPSDVVVCCMKWGERYPADYVNRLARAVAANLSTPHRFICFTDVPAGLAPTVEARPLPPIPLERSRWNNGIWPKLGLFAEGVLPEGQRALFLDLDVMIVGPLDPFAARIAPGAGLWIIREWNPALLKLLPVAWRPDRGGNSSVVGWVAGEQRRIHAKFCESPEAALREFRNDQEFITQFAEECKYWPYDLCSSFKRHCIWYWPLNLIFRKVRAPSWSSVIVFHGKPDPTDLLVDDPNHRWGARRKFGYGPVPWVQDYWRRYGGS